MLLPPPFATDDNYDDEADASAIGIMFAMMGNGEMSNMARAR